MNDSDESLRVSDPVCSDCATKGATACLHKNKSFDNIPPDPLVGRVVNDRYRVDSLIGAGGWGRVYKVFHLGLHKALAMKVLHSSHLFDKEKLKRFKVEAESIGKLDHPNICHVHDFADGPEGQPCMVMELLQGQSLADRLKCGQLFSLSEVLEIGTQMCSALGQAHSKGIVHRDLTPRNVMLLDGDGTKIKILDFGLAKVLEGESAEKSVTETGGVVGTPSYMSPEQCQGFPVDARTDIYALACVIYEAFCGKKAFDGATVLEIMMAHLKSVPKEFVQPNSPAQHRQFQSVLFKALERSPDNRYQSMTELLADLKKLGANETVTITNKRRSSSKWRNLSAFACSAFIVAAGCVFWQVQQQNESDIPMSDSVQEALRPERVNGKTLEQLNKDIEANPDSADAYLARAKFHRRRDERDNAIEDYTSVLKLDPENGQALSDRSALYILVTKYDLALADAQRYLEVFPHSNVGYGVRAAAYAALEDYHRSIADATKAIELFSRYDSGYSTLARVYSALGQHQKALDSIECCFSNSTNSADDNYWNHYERGLVYLRASEYQKALDDFKAANSAHSKMAQSWADMAATYAALGQVDQALPLIDRASKLDLFPARAYRLRGEMYRAAGDWRNAIEAYSTSTSLEPWYAPGFMQRAIAEICSGAVRSAKLDLEKAVKLQPSSAEANSWLALAEDQLGERASSREHLEKAFELIPDLPINFVNRARIEANAGNLEQSIQSCNAAIKLDSRCSQAYITRAQLLAAAQRNTDAAKDEEIIHRFNWHRFSVPLKVASHQLGKDVLINHPEIGALAPAHSVVIVSPKLTESQLWCLAPTHIFFDPYTEIPDDDNNLAYLCGSEYAVKLAKRNVFRYSDISDRSSLIRFLDSVEQHGSSGDFKEILARVQSMSPAQLHQYKDSLDSDEKFRVDFVLNNRSAPGNQYLDGFDLVRAMAFTRLGYSCGYLTEMEAWERLHRCAKRIQTTFSSWEDLANNYLTARPFFYGETPESQHDYADHAKAWEQRADKQIPFKTALSL